MPYPEYPDPSGSGQAAIDFLGQFTMSEGRAIGEPIDQALAPFQVRAITALFGHRDPVTNTTVFQVCRLRLSQKERKDIPSGNYRPAIPVLRSGEIQRNHDSSDLPKTGAANADVITWDSPVKRGPFW